MWIREWRMRRTITIAPITKQATTTSHGELSRDGAGQGSAEVVREEEHGEGNDDQVVEEQDPAGDEAGQIVERTAGDRRGSPVSGIAAVPSAYESETTRKRMPVTSRTTGVSPSAWAATMPSAK